MLDQKIGFRSIRPLLSGALLALGAPVLQAQGLLALAASDPVGIGRSGTGVAFGRSLEAVGQNPALLATLTDRTSAYLAGGMEFQSAQATLFSNQQTHYTTDRNRVLPALGAAWRLSPAVVLGLRLDVPFLRHGRLPEESPLRFHGEALDLKTHRLALQASWAANDRLSFGVAAGVVQVQFASGSSLRAVVREHPALPGGSANPSLGLVEFSTFQEGKATVPSLAAGFRFALDPRWTVGAAVQSPLRGTLSLEARRVENRALVYYGNDGLSTNPLDGIGPKAADLLAASTVRAGDGTFELPGRLTLGVRHRVNPLFTWEADLAYIASSRIVIPEQASLQAPQGAVPAQSRTETRKNGLAFSLLGELALGKKWVARAGLALDPPFRADHDIEPMLGGGRTASFSAGVGYNVFGGQVNFGFQFRQTQDTDNSTLDGVWSVQGFRSTGTPIRVEGMGHVFSLGFRKAF